MSVFSVETLHYLNADEIPMLAFLVNPNAHSLLRHVTIL